LAQLLITVLSLCVTVLFLHNKKHVPFSSLKNNIVFAYVNSDFFFETVHANQVRL